jgi:hypothetical protein
MLAIAFIVFCIHLILILYVISTSLLCFFFKPLLSNSYVLIYLPMYTFKTEKVKTQPRKHKNFDGSFVHETDKQYPLFSSCPFLKISSNVRFNERTNHQLSVIRGAFTIDSSTSTLRRINTDIKYQLW